MRPYIKSKKWWHVYMIKLERDKVLFYTGITCRGIGKRFGDYLLRRGNGYVNSVCNLYRRIPVYVEYLHGNEYEARKREKQIKHLNQKRKFALISSDNNMLIRYIPLKGLILKKNNCLDECVFVRIN